MNGEEQRWFEQQIGKRFDKMETKFDDFMKHCFNRCLKTEGRLEGLESTGEEQGKQITWLYRLILVGVVGGVGLAVVSKLVNGG